MRRWCFLALSCLASCQLFFLPDKNLFLENTVLTCFDEVDNDNKNGADCEDPSCEIICNDDQLTVGSLTHNNCTIISHLEITGDDHGGIAVGASRVLYSGDDRTASFALDDLDAIGFGDLLYEALFSDLRTGKIYTLMIGDSPLSEVGDVTGFQEVDPNTGALLEGVIALSQSIPFEGDVGIFSGKGRLVLHSRETAYDINLSTGAVSAFNVPAFNHQTCEALAYWGVAEFSDEQISLVYAQDANTVSRIKLSDLSTEVVTRFPMISDMCSISVSPSKNRWYFHSEIFTSMSGLEEQLGYCDAVLGDLPLKPVCGDGIFQAPEGCDDGNLIDNDGCTACLLDPCGDGVVNNIIQGNNLEACDDGNNISGDGCRGDCIGNEECGDFLLDVNEQCEDGNQDDNDGCEGSCQFVCGAGLSPLMAFKGVSGSLCYVVLSTPVDWFSARQLCVDIGGDLAALSNATENNLVFPAAVNFNVWIGLNDLAAEGNFVWSNGEAFSFGSFAPGEPNNTGEEDCVQYIAEGWNDLLCDKGNKPLCEVPNLP